MAEAESVDKFYYRVTPYPSAEYVNWFESFVIEVDAAKKAEIDAIFAQAPVFFDGQIAAGSVPYNRNYYAPGQQVWNWHFTSIGRLYSADLYPFYGPPETSAKRESNPSDIAANPQQWIATNGNYYFPTGHLILGGPIDPQRPKSLVSSQTAFARSSDKCRIRVDPWLSIPPA